jgi:hypothetical protein
MNQELIDALKIVLDLAGGNLIDERDEPEENARQAKALDLAIDYIHGLTPDPDICIYNKIRYIESHEYCIDFLKLDKDNQEVFTIWDRNDTTPEGYSLTGELEPTVNEAYKDIKELFSN